MSKGAWITEKTLRSAKDAVKGFRIELEGGEPWLDGDDMVNVQRIWDRDKLKEYAGHLGDLEDILVGLLAVCFPAVTATGLLAERDALREALEKIDETEPGHKEGDVFTISYDCATCEDMKELANAALATGERSKR